MTERPALTKPDAPLRLAGELDRVRGNTTLLAEARSKVWGAG